MRLADVPHWPPWMWTSSRIVELVGGVAKYVVCEMSLPAVMAVPQSIRSFLDLLFQRKPLQMSRSIRASLTGRQLMVVYST